MVKPRQATEKRLYLAIRNSPAPMGIIQRLRVTYPKPRELEEVL